MKSKVINFIKRWGLWSSLIVSLVTFITGSFIGVNWIASNLNAIAIPNYIIITILSIIIVLCIGFSFTVLHYFFNWLDEKDNKNETTK